MTKVSGCEDSNSQCLEQGIDLDIRSTLKQSRRLSRKMPLRSSNLVNKLVRFTLTYRMLVFSLSSVYF